MKNLFIFLFVFSFVFLLVGCGSTVSDRGQEMPDLSGEVSDDICVAHSGDSITLDEAMDIAEGSNCAQEGEIQRACNCNEGTGTCWLDIEAKKPGCNPACVVDLETKEAQVNWRCTGLIVD